jgi:hypothetical protein
MRLNTLTTTGLILYLGYHLIERYIRNSGSP